MKPYLVDEIEILQQTITLEKLVNQFVYLNEDFMGSCILCDSKGDKQSFILSQLHQLYRCTDCQRHGNIFSFLQDYRKMTFHKACEYLMGVNNHLG